jgi:hypothetical protein
MTTTSECLFCRGPGPFSTTQHIVPESLGNDNDVLDNAVCDACQSYLGREIEKPALEKTPIAVWRTLLSIPTKKKRLPHVQLDPPRTGRIRARHPFSDTGVGLTAHRDGSTSLDLEDPHIVRAIVDGRKSDYRMVLSPWHLHILSRFLGKMGLEFLALHDRPLAMSGKFDLLREYVRRGSLRYLWPIYWGQQGDMQSLRSVHDDGTEIVECYRYGLGEDRQGKHLFAFAIGTDVMLLCLSEPSPAPELEHVVDGIHLRCIHYSDQSWL